jgi:hypothetical protein
MIPLEYNNDQRREFVNTQQRFRTWLDLKARVVASRGSMVWQKSKGTEYLARSYYDKAGIRRQTSLGPRSPQTESTKRDFEIGRQEANAQFKEIDAALTRQGAVNRALGLGRVPLTGARIIRSLDDVGLLGAGVRVVGTNAIYAFEAAAGIMVDPGITTTGDIDLLFDSRRELRFVVSDDANERSLIKVLKQIDKTFERTANHYRAQNSQGYLVDLIKPLRNPPWRKDILQVGDNSPDDLTAAEIEGLVWLENAPAFESVAIDERGMPLRIITADPRVWAIHKHWLAKRADRNPLKRRRDAEQAMVVGGIVRDYLPHLPFHRDDLKVLPKEVVADAAQLFEAEKG